MDKCYLDSNVLIYFKDTASAYHKRSVDKLVSLTEKNFSLYISSLVLDEFLYVFHYFLLKKKIPNPFYELKKALQEVISLPNLSIVSVPTEAISQLEVVDYMEKYRLHSRDAYHLLTMRKNDINYFATFDNDFNAVFKTKILKSV